MPADSPMVLVPRGLLERVLSYVPSRGPLAFDVMEALSASPVGEGSKPTGEQIVCGNDWQRRMFAPSATSTAEQVGAEAGLVEAGHVVWWKEGGVNYFPQGEGFSVSRSCRVEPLVTRESALAAIAAARAAPSPGEGDARHCPCGKPSLPTASICSDCADACLASGEGDAPVAWQWRLVDANGKRPSGWMLSETDPRDDPSLRGVRMEVRGLIYTPATPEGLREAVTVIRDLLADEADGDPVQRAKDFLSALQPQAQGGE